MLVPRLFVFVAALTIVACWAMHRTAPPSFLLAILPVGLVILLQELFTLSQMGSKYRLSSELPNCDPTILFESDRTFVEMIAAISAAIIAFGLEKGKLAEPEPAKWSLGVCLLLCFMFLDVQGGALEKEDSGQVCYHAQRQYLLVSLKNIVFWTFLYGVSYVMIARQGP